MNKKAMIMLIFCAIGFVAASFLFFRYSDKYTSEDLYLGEKQIQVFQTYQEADADLYYIQHTAILSVEKAFKDNFKSEFESNMNSYLTYFKLTSSDFEIEYISSVDKTTIVGISKKELTYIEADYT